MPSSRPPTQGTADEPAADTSEPATKQDLLDLKSELLAAIRASQGQRLAVQSLRYLTVEDVAALTGFTPEAVRMMVKRSRIPFSRVNGRVRFDRLKIEKWFERGTNHRMPI